MNQLDITPNEQMQGSFAVGGPFNGMEINYVEVGRTTVVPEAGMLALLAMGGGGWWMRRRTRPQRD